MMKGLHKENESQTSEIRFSIEQAVDIVRQFRNTIIKKYLYNESLKNYYVREYDKELSSVKMEFLKRDLTELLISPVDLIHYASLIKELQNCKSDEIPEIKNELFYQELQVLFNKYN